MVHVNRVSLVLSLWCFVADGKVPSRSTCLVQTGTRKKSCSSCHRSVLFEQDGDTADDLIAPSDKTHRPHKEDISVAEGICEQDVFARPEPCPAECPYAAEMANKFCHFRCVKPNECGTLGTVPNATIPSDKLHTCRFCNVEACMTCQSGKPGEKSKRLEHCLECMPGYWLTKEGECAMRGLWVFTAITLVAVVVVFILGTWYLRVLSRPCVNQAGLDTAARVRSRTMVLQNSGFPGEVGGEYPLTTNLLGTNVAGIGTMCLFRFQFALLAWAVILLVAWLLLAVVVSTDLLILGNRDVKSPQMLCAIVAWGHQRQVDLLWTKVVWLCFAYLFSFGCATVYAVQQAKLVWQADASRTTMCDFVAVLDGMPQMQGSEQVEALVKEKVFQATGQEVVGASIAWDYETCSCQIEEEVERDYCAEEAGLHGGNARAAHPVGFDVHITKRILDAWHVHLDHDGQRQAPTDAEMKQLLLGLKSAPVAFVVFRLEAGRDMAIDAVKDMGVEINGIRCSLHAGTHEPTEILWENLSVTKQARSMNLIRGTLLVVGACVLWTLLLYLPYAHFMASFSYARGDEPGHFSEGIFIGLVVGSQIGLFIVSSRAAKKTGFRYESQVQTTYTLFYNLALIVNLCLDIVLQAYLSYLSMVGVGAHTDDGRLLGEITNLQDIFESYPMQKSVGKLLFTYCWPCTFFVPFLAEPLVAQWLPQHIGRLLVGADDRIRGLNASKALERSEMEQGRYADVIFNVILVTCIPFIAPAYLHQTLIVLIVSHVYLYCYDQVKVLRCVVCFELSSVDVHTLGMKLFAIPVSILAGALVFKANQLSAGKNLGSGFLKGYALSAAIVGAMLVHGLLHLAMLRFVIATCSTDIDRSDSLATYEVAAQSFPATYFSVNPVHCLRTKYGINQAPREKCYSPLRRSKSVPEDK